MTEYTPYIPIGAAVLAAIGILAVQGWKIFNDCRKAKRFHRHIANIEARQKTGGYRHV